MKPPLCDPFHADEFHHLEDQHKKDAKTIALLREHLEWALERVEPNEGDDNDMEAYHTKWNNAFALIQEDE